jgi:small ligand-binding sensory domain FIST
MTAFSSAFAVADTWNAACSALISELSLPQTPAGEQLGFLYVNSGFADDLASMLTFLRSQTKIEHWVGTVGMGVVGTGQGAFSKPAASVLVGDFAPGSFQVFGPTTGELEPAAAEAIKGFQPITGIVHADPRQWASVQALDALADLAGPYLLGGFASSTNETQLVQVADKVVEGGLSGVLFNETVPLMTGLSQGCLPIGPVHQITDGEGSLIKELDGKPAIDVFKEEAAAALDGDMRRVAGTIHVALMVPGADTGDYVVRNLTGIDPNAGHLAIGDEIVTGDTIRLVRREPVTAAQDLTEKLETLSKRLSGPPKAGIYISCVARGPALFGSEAREIEMIKETLGEFPLTGFYASGEISHDRLYGYTGVLTLFV